jgi:Holliday junction resolvasome RuvABC DNA-binding subunit
MTTPTAEQNNKEFIKKAIGNAVVLLSSWHQDGTGWSDYDTTVFEELKIAQGMLYENPGFTNGADQHLFNALYNVCNGFTALGSEMQEIKDAIKMDEAASAKDIPSLTWEQAQQIVAEKYGCESFGQATWTSKYSVDELYKQANELCMQANLQAFADMLGYNNAWPAQDVLEKLLWATDYLLHKKDCDVHGWEEIEVCWQRGKEILAKMRSIPPFKP